MKGLATFIVLLICIIFSFSAKSQEIEGTVAGHEFRLDKVEKELRKLRTDYSKLIESGASEAQKRELEQMMDRKMAEFKSALQEMMQKESAGQVAGFGEQVDTPQKPIEAPSKKNTGTNEDMLRLLAQGLSDSHSGNRFQTINALGKMGQPALRYIGVAALNDSDSSNRNKAIKILIGIGLPALEYIGTSALNDSNSDIREIAIEALGRFGKPSLPYLQYAAVRDAVSDNRSLALKAIEEIIQQENRKTEEERAEKERAEEEKQRIEKERIANRWKFNFGPSATSAFLLDKYGDVGVFFTIGPGILIRKAKSAQMFSLDIGGGINFSTEGPDRGDDNGKDVVVYSSDRDFIWRFNANTMVLFDKDFKLVHSDQPASLIGGAEFSLISTKHKGYIGEPNEDKDETYNAFYTLISLLYGAYFYDGYGAMLSLGGGLRVVADETDPAFIVGVRVGYFPF